MIRIRSDIDMSSCIGTAIRNFLKENAPERLQSLEMQNQLDQIERNTLPSHSWGNLACTLQLIEMTAKKKISARHIISLCTMKCRGQL